MKKLLILMLLLPAASLAQVREDGSFRSLLKGAVASGENRKLYVMKSLDYDREINDKSIIPVVGGKFEYVLEGDYVQSYTLAFLDEFMAGSFSYLEFFPDTEVVEFPINNTERLYYNTVMGGEINRAMNEFKAAKDNLFGKRQGYLIERMNALHDSDLYSSEEAKSIFKELNEMNERVCDAEEMQVLYDRLDELRKTGKDKTPEAAELSEKYDILYKEIKKWQYEYMMSHPDIHSYSMLLRDISSYRHSSAVFDIADMEKAFAALSAANPNHRDNAKIAHGLYAIKYLAPGNMFVDFTAPTLDGQIHILSEEIKGKVAVIDLWASWCASCRRNSMKLIPLYEKYNERGFTVVGVAREFKNTDDLVIALGRDGYPWLNLVELDDRAGIWGKYGAGNAGGRVILVDEEGRIVRLDATVKEIAEYLSSKFDRE